MKFNSVKLPIQYVLKVKSYLIKFEIVKQRIWTREKNSQNLGVAATQGQK